MVQSNYIKYNNKIKVNFIGKVENLHRDIDKINKILNTKYKINKNIGKSNRDRDYRKYYNRETKEIVRNICKQDIEEFDYKF